jgi:hypothetical protein
MTCEDSRIYNESSTNTQHPDVYIYGDVFVELFILIQVPLQRKWVGELHGMGVGTIGHVVNIHGAGKGKTSKAEESLFALQFIWQAQCGIKMAYESGIRG